jgi:hypothetical protein
VETEKVLVVASLRTNDFSGRPGLRDLPSHFADEESVPNPYLN